MIAWIAIAMAAEPADLLELGRVLLDDRLDVEERVDAAEALGAKGDPRALWLLRAGAGARAPAVQEASALAALRIEDPEAVQIAGRVLADPIAPTDVRLDVVEALGEHGTSDAARVLWHVVADRDVRARVRDLARTTLETRYPDELALLGPPHSVVDPLGGVAFVAANGVAGGVLLSRWPAGSRCPRCGRCRCSARR